jgi:HEPN domain-containing protein/predicted nucleotidyltransferase
MVTRNEYTEVSVHDMIRAPLPPDLALERVTKAIVERFSPERVQLFGSRARGDAHEWSDYDLIVVLETELSRSERTSLVRAAIEGHALPVELFVYTPAEFLRQRHDVGTLVYAAEREGRVLYERPGSALGVPAPPRVREERRRPPDSLRWWIARAENDFSAMATLSGTSGGPTDAVCLHAHAGVEKLLKAVLVAAHTPPPRTHDLREVLDLCAAPLRESAGVRPACALLDGLYGKSRYPNEDMPSVEEANSAVAAAGRIRDAVRGQGLF